MHVGRAGHLMALQTCAYCVFDDAVFIMADGWR